MSVNIKPYIIINGKNSNEITGLMITKLPPISKPAMRVEAEEIDGRDGDIVTELGFSAYDKEIEIGLYGEYDVNDVIEYFNQSGQVIFSNEPDKYYRFAIYNAIDFEKLINFKTATVTFHVQPFKFDVVSNDAVFFSPSNVSITNDGNIYSRPELAIQGSGNVGISVNGSDVLEIELGASQQAIIIDSDGMNAYGTKTNIKELIVDVNPVQDLHGYDKPWAGGGGANLWGGDKMYDDFVATEQVTSGTDSTGKYIQWYSTATWSIPLTCEANTQYTLMLYGWRNTATTEGTSYGFNCRLYYSDETFTNITVVSAGNQVPARIVVVSSANKTLTSIGVINHGEYSRIYTDNCGLFKGVKTASDFVPWENICPISGWNGCDVTRTGKNLLSALKNLQGTNGIVSSLTNNGHLLLSGSATSTWGYVSNLTPTKLGAGTYTLSIENPLSFNIYINTVINGINTNRVITAGNTSITFTTTGIIEGLRIVVSGLTKGQNINSEIALMLEKNSTATSFQKYVGNPYALFFEGLINGTYGYVDMGTLSWVGGGTNIFACTLSGLKVGTSGLSPLLCPIYTTKNITNQAPTQDKTIWQYYNSSNIRVYDTSYDDVSDFQNAMNGVYLIYELATPTTPTITQADINMLMTAFGIDEESAIVVFGQEVYGATINITTGLLTLIGGIYSTTWTQYNQNNGYKAYRSSSYIQAKSYDNAKSNMVADFGSFSSSSMNQNIIQLPINSQGFVYMALDENADASSVQIYYEYAQPIEIQLTAQEIMTLIGKNVLWANTGAINELIYTKDGVDITTSGDIVSFDVDAIDIIDTILKNRLVTGNYDNLRLKAGTNQIAVSGDVSVMVLSNFSRWL